MISAWLVQAMAGHRGDRKRFFATPAQTFAEAAAVSRYRGCSVTARRLWKTRGGHQGENATWKSRWPTSSEARISKIFDMRVVTLPGSVP